MSSLTSARRLKPSQKFLELATPLPIDDRRTTYCALDYLQKKLYLGDVATKQDLKELEYRLIIKLGALVGAIVTFAVAITAAISKFF